MSANTTTLAGLFDALYSPLRRAYSDYAHNYGGKIYIVYANITLLRKERIPYYFSHSAAYQHNEPMPGGWLPLDLSDYYFKEVPVMLYPVQLSNLLIGNIPSDAVFALKIY